MSSGCPQLSQLGSSSVWGTRPLSPTPAPRGSVLCSLCWAQDPCKFSEPQATPSTNTGPGVTAQPSPGPCHWFQGAGWLSSRRAVRWGWEQHVWSSDCGMAGARLIKVCHFTLSLEYHKSRMKLPSLFLLSAIKFRSIIVGKTQPGPSSQMLSCRPLFTNPA